MFFFLLLFIHILFTCIGIKLKGYKMAIGIYKSNEEEDEWVLYIGTLSTTGPSALTDDDVHGVMANLMSNGPENTRVEISSTGGEFSVYQMLHSYLVGRGTLFKSTEAAGDCASTAYAIFMLSNCRVVNELSVLTIHSTTFQSLTTSQHHNNAKEIKHLNSILFSECLEVGHITNDEYDMLIFKEGTKPGDIVILPQEAMDRGIATHMRYRGKLYNKGEWDEYNNKK